MAGPCTLLAQPHLNRYIDTDGVHDMPWVGPMAAGQVLSPVQGPDAFYELADVPTVALSSFIGFADLPKSYSAPNQLIGGNATADPQTSLTVTNGTKAVRHPFSALQDGLEIDLVPDGEAFLATSALGGHWFARVYGNANFGNTTYLVATGPDLTATRTTLAGMPSRGLIYAILANGQSEPRTVQFVRGGADFMLPIVVPAKAIVSLAAAQYFGFAAGQEFGIKITDSVAGDHYLLHWLGVNGTPDYARPIPFEEAHASTTLEQDLNGYGPITLWAGTPRASVATEGESYWRVPLNRSHIGEEKGAIISRFKPFGWPASPNFSAFCIDRMGQIAYDFDPGYVYLCMYGYYDTYSSPFPDNYRVFTEFSPVGSAGNSGLGDGAYFKKFDLPIGEAPTNDFYLGSVAWNGAEVRQRLGDHDATESRTVWEGLDFPFLGIEPETEPVYLHGGAASGNWQYTATWHRDVALFDRPLTDAEYAFVNDPDSVWALNMFAEPAEAVLTMPAEIVRGDTVRLEVTIKDAAGDAVPLPGLTFWQTWKPEGDMAPDDRNAYGTSYLAIGNDGNATAATNASVIDALEGRLELVLDAADSAAMRPGESVAVDIQAQTIEGDIVTLYRGTVAIVADVTRSTAAPA